MVGVLLSMLNGGVHVIVREVEPIPEEVTLELLVTLLLQSIAACLITTVRKLGAGSRVDLYREEWIGDEVVDAGEDELSAINLTFVFLAEVLVVPMIVDEVTVVVVVVIVAAVAAAAAAAAAAAVAVTLETIGLVSMNRALCCCEIATGG